MRTIALPILYHTYYLLNFFNTKQIFHESYHKTKIDYDFFLVSILPPALLAIFFSGRHRLESLFVKAQCRLIFESTPRQKPTGGNSILARGRSWKRSLIQTSGSLTTNENKENDNRQSCVSSFRDFCHSLVLFAVLYEEILFYPSKTILKAFTARIVTSNTVTWHCRR